MSHLQPPSINDSQMIVIVLVLFVQVVKATFQPGLFSLVFQHLPIDRVLLKALITQLSVSMLVEDLEGVDGKGSDHSGWGGGECQRAVEGLL